jgi:hypothetical protein
LITPLPLCYNGTVNRLLYQLVQAAQKGPDARSRGARKNEAYFVVRLNELAPKSTTQMGLFQQPIKKKLIEKEISLNPAVI